MSLVIKETALVDAVFQGFVSAADMHDWLAHIDGLIARQQPFFFIATTREHTEFAEDYRAIQGLWYKQHKAAFREVCLGLVRIANDPEELARLDTPALHAAWGVPYHVTLDRAQGYQWIAQRMVQA